jgi:hypothetical protein
VGPGRFELAERYIEERYQTKYYSEKYPDGTNKPPPPDRGGLMATANRVFGLCAVAAMYAVARGMGYRCSMKIQDALEENLVVAREDMEKRGIHHTLEWDEEPTVDAGLTRTSIWGKSNKASE